MDRRTFITRGLLAGAAVAAAPAALATLSGCRGPQLRADGSPEPHGVDAFLAQGARTMWIAAHPDDECFCGTVLARSSIHYGNPLQMVLMTRGDGGECCLPQGCVPDVGTVRIGEMRKVADLYRAGLTQETFFNAPLPVESFPKRHEMFEIWKRHRDPVAFLVDEIRKFKPDIVFTFEPTHGATGHPEHQLTSRLATTAVRMAADPAVAGDDPHRVERTYFLLNRFWLMRAFGAADPGPVSEVFDATLRATDTLSCADFMSYATRLHETQFRDMENVRKFRIMFNNLPMRRVDPFTQSWDPAEPA